MAGEGAAVAVAARTEQQWDDRLPGTIGETVAQIERQGGRAVAIRADLLQREDRRRLVEQARAALGAITVLVNNAAFTAPGRPPQPESGGTDRPSPPPATPAGRDATPRTDRRGPGAKADWPGFVSTPATAYERHFLIGPFAAYELMQLVVPDMAAAGYGSIINITSGASRMPGEGPYPDRTEGILPGYGGSKAALEHLTMAAAYELVDRNIAVNALSPSKAIFTPGVAFYSREFDDYAPAEDFAEAAVRLATADPQVLTGRVLGHLDVLDGSFRPYTR
jgi:NAD(P)-dependent dehydrogenase (short-subunit alcohol dehydrogenase family)